MIKLAKTFEESEECRRRHYLHWLDRLARLERFVEIPDSRIGEHTPYASQLLQLLENVFRYGLDRLLEIDALYKERNQLYFELAELKAIFAQKEAA